jgi:hypothetical protein
VGDYRVVFKVIEFEVWILGVRHRKSVCMDIGVWDVKNAPKSIILAVHPKIQGEDVAYKERSGSK